MGAPPFPFVWLSANDMRGCCFVPKRGFEKRAAQWFKDGETVVLAPFEPRSMPSHNHFFAELNDLWGNLPEPYSSMFPSSEHLRYRALIETGYYNDQAYVCETEAEALRMALMAKGLDPFIVTSISGTTLVVRKAKSQSMYGKEPMSKQEFQASKESVLEYVRALIGINQENVA